MEDDALQPSAEILRLIAKNFAEMVLAYDMNRKLVFVNPAVETLTGYSMAELQKANFIRWVHPDDEARMMSFWDSLFHGKSFHEEEYRLITRDQRVKWVIASWYPIIDDAGNQVGVQGREVEITQRKLAEASLRHSDERLREDQERYRALFENSPFPMWEEDFSGVKQYLDGLTRGGVPDIPAHLASHRGDVMECVRRVRILDVNRAARDFYAASSKEDLLVGLDQIFDEAALTVFRDEISTLIQNHTSFHTEFAARTLRGEERLVDMIVSIVESARLDWSRVIVCFFDITDRKRLEEQMLQSQKMESLGRLAGGIAHDFNNLLTVINGYTDMVMRRMEPNSMFREPLAEVRSAGERCAELTQQLLAFSRKQVLRAAPLDLNRVIREAQTVLDRLLGDDVRIVTRLDPELGAIHGDSSQIHQVLMNLTANARDAMPSGGTLTIATSNSADGREVLLEIRDTGEGMDESTRRHLFEPFFTTKNSTHNTGLGLATVFGIVNHAGGRIEVQSQPGAGTAFRIYLPRTEGAPDVPLRADKTAHRGNSRVLVVEDRAEVRNMACQMLQELGYETIAAAGSAEALWMARGCEEPIPLLLTDVIMPGANGRELAEQLREIFPRIKTIFMSGYSDRILADGEVLQAGTRFLQKPFTLGQLAELLHGLAEEGQ